MNLYKPISAEKQKMPKTKAQQQTTTAQQTAKAQTAEEIVKSKVYLHVDI